MFPYSKLATTDPAAATDALNLLEEGFAAFLRTSRPSSRNPQATISPRLSVYNPSPRLPSALPPSASPRVVEPLTPDRGQPVLPFYSESDAVDLVIQPSPCEQAVAAERARRIEWTRSQPAPVPRMPPNSVGVVDEDVADRMFSAARKGRPGAVMLSAPEPARVGGGDVGRHPAMKLELAPLRSGEMELTPRMLGVGNSPFGGLGKEGRASPFGSWGKDILGSFAGQKRGEVRTAPAGGAGGVLLRDDRGGGGGGGGDEVGGGGGGGGGGEGMGSSSSISGEEGGKERYGIGGVKKRGSRRREESWCMEDVEKRMLGSGRRGSKLVGGGDPLKCHLCGQRFARRSNLFKHLRSVHEEVRRFACSSCSFKFKRQDHLLKHTRSVHNKVRKFQCEICGIGFAEKFNRDKHTKSIHFTKRAFQCACGAYFQDRDKMLRCLRCKTFKH